jgi:ribosomal protein L17
VFFYTGYEPVKYNRLDVRQSYVRVVNKNNTCESTVQDNRRCLVIVFDLVFNLVNQVDVEETERKISEYRDINKDIISQNRGKLVRIHRSCSNKSIVCDVYKCLFQMIRVKMTCLLNI